jgi:DNA-binding NarL/FixJ family response regulator
MSTLILADDHQILREALRMLLEMQPDLRVIAETGDGLEALQLTEKHKPDELIVDMMKRASPATKVLVLSMHDTESYVVESLQAGVAGYVLKKSSSQELVFAIRQALAGNLFLSPPLNERAIQAYMQHAQDARTADPLDALTERELEVFQLAAEGLSNPQIAERLVVSVRTVEMHRSNLMKKLGLKTQTDLVKFAVNHGVAS